ncbi:Transcriptional activator spt7 [Schistosoma haematobium]|uniref:Transcriptional activator spt7 n=1 Tax=Schistosoma haematobium TaxID=6185 RepID=A0A922LSU0_SCHHA|nr:Transcriptional activator spt7 [Schistosoma haematobium]KAH9592738.1 Transcriptional activator spt7 [Schistosoma haematobium]
MINSMLIMIIVSLNIYINCIPISNNIWTLKQNTGSFQSQNQVQTFNTSGYSIQKQSQTQSFINTYNNGQQIIQQQIQQQNQQFNSIQSQAQYQSINSGNLQPINTLPMIIQPNQNDGLQISIDQTQQPFDSQIYNQPESLSQPRNDVGHSIPDHYHQQQEEQSTELPQESQNSEIQRTQEIQNEANSQKLDSSPQSDQSQSNVDGSILVQPPLSEQFRAIQNGQNQSSQQSQPGIDSQRQPDSSPQSDQSQSNVDGLLLVQPPLSEQFRAIQNGQNQSSQQSQPGIDSQRQPDSSPQSDQSQSNVDGLLLVQPPLSEQFRAIQNGQNQSSQQSQPGIDSRRQPDSSPQSDQSQSNVDGLILVQPQSSGLFQVSDSPIPNVSNPIFEQHSEFDNSFSSEPTRSLESHLSPDSPLSDQQHQRLR